MGADITRTAYSAEVNKNASILYYIKGGNNVVRLGKRIRMLTEARLFIPVYLQNYELRLG